MVFVEQAGDVQAADLLLPRSSSESDDKLSRALVFLAQGLTDGEWHDSNGLKTLAGSQGISERTLQRAAGDLKVEHERRGFPASTHWRLRRPEPPSRRRDTDPSSRPRMQELIDATGLTRPELQAALRKLAKERETTQAAVENGRVRQLFAEDEATA